MSKYSKIAPTEENDLIKQFGSTYSYIKKGSIVLDVGCSSGYYANILRKDKGCIVDGIEIDEGDRKKAEKILRKVYNFDLDSKEWPVELTSQQYDVVFMGDVIEHVKGASEVLEKLKNILKKDGVIIISTPNIAHITARLELLSGNFEYETTGIFDETHLKYFTLSSLKRLIENSGFTLQEVDYSLADLMPDLIENWLKKIGLKANDKFWKIVNKPDARAYQYKLVIKKRVGKTKEKNVKLPTKPIEDKYWFLGQIDYLNKMAKESLDENHKLKLKIIELETKNTSLKYHISELRIGLQRRIKAKIKK